MSMITIKEAAMLLLGLGLIFSLYYLKTHDNILVSPPTEVASTPMPPVAEASVSLPKPEVLPAAIIEQVQIPNWLADKDDFDLSNLTIDDLLSLAQLSHEEGHDFFPENQNTLFYAMKAKELGTESEQLEALLSDLSSKLHKNATQAFEDRDETQLTALTARLKTLSPEDALIDQYTEQINTITTLKKLVAGAEKHHREKTMFSQTRDDAVHKILMAEKLGLNYQPLTEIKDQIISELSQQAIRSAQELDFVLADARTNIMKRLDENHQITQATIASIASQKRNRFAYLDQQFDKALSDLNLNRAQNMFDALTQLEISQPQLAEYQNLLLKTRTYGPYELFDVFSDRLQTGGNGPAMVVMPTGDFFMGKQGGAKHQRPVHLVDIAYGFAISQHEITVAAFQQFIEATSYTTTANRNKNAKVYDPKNGRFKPKRNVDWRYDYTGKRAPDNNPVIHVSWEDAQAYVTWLSEVTGESYRLPSESEFEYVLSMGNDYLYPWGNEEPEQIIGNLSGAKDRLRKSRVRWREGFSEYSDGHWGPAPVGSFIPNLFGLYDLSGNVMEWVADCWHDSYFRAPGDGSAWINRGCPDHVIRGGNWASPKAIYQTRHRIKAERDLTDPRIGFRVARNINFENKS